VRPQGKGLENARPLNAPERKGSGPEPKKAHENDQKRKPETDPAWQEHQALVHGFEALVHSFEPCLHFLLKGFIPLLHGLEPGCLDFPGSFQLLSATRESLVFSSKKIPLSPCGPRPIPMVWAENPHVSERANPSQGGDAKPRVPGQGPG